MPIFPARRPAPDGMKTTNAHVRARRVLGLPPALAFTRVRFCPERRECRFSRRVVFLLRSSKTHEFAGGKIIWSSWFYVGAARGYTYHVGLKAKAREHSSNSLPATANGI